MLPPTEPAAFRPETLRNFAREVLKLPLTDPEVEPLRKLLDALLAEVALVDRDARADSEPACTFALEDWAG